jgi:glucose-6-phosphate isomerase
MRTSSFRRSSAAAAAAILLLLACGPFGYLKKVAKDATRSVADAKAAGAEQYAPYEYWGAVTYLEQAKILMAYSEYERSFDYGVRAKQLAEEAKKKADRREGETTEPPADGPATPPAQSEPAPQPEAEAEADAEAEGGGEP